MTVDAGLNDYTLTSTRREWNRDTGKSIVKTYVGPIDKIDAFYSSLINDPDVDRISDLSEHGKGTLEVFVADEDVSGIGSVTVGDNITWELVPQDITKPIRSLGAPAPTAIVFNEAALQDVLEDTRLFYETAQTSGTLPVGEPQETYLKLLQQGSSEYVRTAAVLRSSLILSARSTLVASFVGVDRAHKLTGQPGSPDINFLGAATFLQLINQMPEADGSKKQWMKRAPYVMTNGNRRFSINQEWWFARRWSETFYGGDQEDGNP